MIGDKLVITDYHRAAAATIFKQLERILQAPCRPVAVSVAGESGCGKSETAAVLAELCAGAGEKPLILQQDDYFIYPPKTNHEQRLNNLEWVGPQEVKLSLIEDNIAAIKEGETEFLTKPLVDYNADLIGEETRSVKNITVIIVEGTYTTTLQGIDLKVFIDRNFRQTKQARLKRSRDPLTGFLEKVLSIEHEIISKHKTLADLVIEAPDHERTLSS